MTIQTKPTRAIRFRGRSFLALVLNPELPVGEWLGEVDAWLGRSPGFFGGKPVVLDVTGLSLDRKSLPALIADLAQRQIRIMGIEGAEAKLASPDLPPFLSGGRPASFMGRPEPEPEPVKTAANPAAHSLLVEAPVRSGQSIVFPEGDVTVMGSIGSGAEVIAGGSIHIYGALRGRAMAGAYGNARARIFCRKLEAELIAIDGLYKIADEIEPQLRKKPVQAWLEDETMKITLLD
ncbi:MAG: septum formation inhibitor MinC [Hyphomicrobiales bacterium]|nr:septum formation inhibitor MinC [Hyphomicrobiales bacterium]